VDRFFGDCDFAVRIELENRSKGRLAAPLAGRFSGKWRAIEQTKTPRKRGR
jgi:hypothetical protein